MIKILVVEDEPDLSNIIRLHLKRAGYAATAAYSCAEALTLLENDSFDLIILDVVLPDQRGTELCTLIRAHSFLSGPGRVQSPQPGSRLMP